MVSGTSYLKPKETSVEGGAILKMEGSQRKVVLSAHTSPTLVLFFGCFVMPQRLINFRQWPQQSRRRSSSVARLESILLNRKENNTPLSVLFRYSLFHNSVESLATAAEIPMTTILLNGKPITQSSKNRRLHTSWGSHSFLRVVHARRGERSEKEGEEISRALDDDAKATQFDPFFSKGTPFVFTHDGRADMTNFEMDLFDTRIEIPVDKGGGGMHSPYYDDEKSSKKRCCKCGSSRNRIIKPACVPISIVSLLIIALVFLPLFNEEDLASPIKLTTGCTVDCKSYLIESIPTGVPFPTNNHTADAWINIIDNTKQYLDISVMYWNLNSSDYETAKYGRRVYEALIRAGKRGVKIRIAQDGASNLSENEESAYLAREGLAEVREINVTRLIGSGIIHTKFILSDIATLYVGSANMDWKSLSEVKELGVVIEECPCVASDLYKIFAAYWKLGENGSVIPDKWPISYRTPFNFTTMAHMKLDGEPAEYFISSSPGPFNPKGREHDLTAIQKIIKSARKSVCISVMDYIPATLYMKNGSRFWPEIDDALRDAAYRGVHVRMLISHWDHSRKEMLPFLKSLQTITDGLPRYNGTEHGQIQVKIFTVPANEQQKKIPFTRVNHAKYMVTENIAYIGTSNWSGDYFISTAGVGMVVRQDAATKRLQSAFDRDWNSEYAKDI
ncbi:Protein CBG19099 [Caenorhabditis briggsae]|uniref:Protein CBG19099 n=1 Tax=Caenorhabditis briggsae TaxID=6238 RepID=A8XUS6_CAEBR|nr:Protein CBG19099 [Caenorhabditis briggsae]CAP36400.2 Protein CBG19099 [Caenorhabditis briggsae]